MTVDRGYASFYEHVETAAPMTPRLDEFVAAYLRHANRRGGGVDVLDIGCGRQAQLSAFIRDQDRYTGCDIAPAEQVVVPDYLQVDLNTTSLAAAVGEERFDVVYGGEVIEHLFSPDALLADVAAILKPDGILILSTPNLAYWLNRLLLLVGISPLFLENSSEVKLGRRFRILGEGNETQGHIRLFTYDAVVDLAARQGLDLVASRGIPVWNFPPDRFVCRFSRRLAPDNVFVFRSSGTDVPARRRGTAARRGMVSRLTGRLAQEGRRR